MNSSTKKLIVVVVAVLMAISVVYKIGQASCRAQLEQEMKRSGRSIQVTADLARDPKVAELLQAMGQKYETDMALARKTFDEALYNCKTNAEARVKAASKK